MKSERQNGIQFGEIAFIAYLFALDNGGKPPFNFTYSRMFRNKTKAFRIFIYEGEF